MKWVTWPTWTPCPYMEKTLKNLPLQNHLIDGLETWYIALSTQALPRLLKLWPWVDLDLFYAKVNCGHIGLYMVKKWKVVIFQKVLQPRSQSWLMFSTKWVNKAEWVSKVKIILRPLAIGHLDFKSELFFSETFESFEIKVLMKAKGNTWSKFYTNEMGQMAAAH